MLNKIRWIAVALMCFTGSAVAEELSEFHQHFADTIGTAHGIKAYREHAAVKADAVITFGGQVLLDGTITFDTPVGRSRIETKDGTVMVLDGRDAWVSPADAPTPPTEARFALLTWPYFIAAPFKLADPGATIDDAGKKPLEAHRILPTGKLTFGSGVGDSPDDWYLVYLDPDSQRLEALAYIVTYGNTRHDAEKQPHVAIYEAYKNVAGVMLPTRISFWNWETSLGKVGEQIGSAEFANYRFVEPDKDTFTKPPGARVDELPASGNEG